MSHRYRVVSVWGQVPEQVREMVGKDETFLLYPEYRGLHSSQGFLSGRDLVGGWWMKYAGKGPPLVPTVARA